LDRRKNHWIDVVVDRLVVRPSSVRRLIKSVELALDLADDVVIANTLSGGDRLFSRSLACVSCGINMPELTPRIFSFNSLHGACSACQGLGVGEDFDPALIVPDATKSLADGAIEPWVQGDRKIVNAALLKLACYFEVDLATPFARLSRKSQDVLLYGPAWLAGSASMNAVRLRGRSRTRTEPFGRDFEGIIPNLRRRYEEGTWEQQEVIEPYRSLRPCANCDGQRLRPESRAVRVKGRTISDYVNLPIAKVREVVDTLELRDREALIADRVLREIRERLQFLTEVGVGYLTLARGTATLSGGEAQRIRLATQIGSNLTGVLYVLDEPSIGLHQRDNRLLLETLGRLRDLGNTVVVVEHDEETIRSADYVIDLGRGAGEHGGQVVFQGTPAQLLVDCGGSLTGEYLRAERTIVTPTVRRPALKGFLVVRGACANNLKAIDVAVPLGVLTAVTGVSGSGKSTLVNDILFRSLACALYRSADKPGAHDEIEGLDLVDKVIQIDQSPIGRTPRSNPATYTGLFTFIRELFSMLPESRARGYKPGRFSFNVKGGRCEACKGDGVMTIEMHFLPDVYVTCEHCKGRRYNRETLDVTYRGASIADVLDLTVDQAATRLEHFPSIATKLGTLRDVGLGYIRLGQSATTLSGGEAQRVKLSKELSRRSTGRTLYILDEPTTGLHFEDIRRLLDVLNKLVDQGNTIIVIEHHLDVIKAADHIIDLGPEGGEGGGAIVAQGTPEEVSRVKLSQTGLYLGRCLSSN
jgi:excinuclease ABC subunit A